MTSSNARDGGRVEEAVDLSSAFGTAAVSSLRDPNGGSRESESRETDGLAPATDRPAAAEPAPQTLEDPETVEDEVQDSTNRRSATATPKAEARPPDVRGARRRLRVAAVKDRRQIDVLLLAVARRRPTSGREFIELVRVLSDGVFLLSERAVYHEIHRLKNNRLIQVAWKNGSRRYLLTALGERVLTTRRREWNAFSHGFDRVLDAVDD